MLSVRRLTILLSAVGLFSLAGGVPASAGSVTATIPISVLSITVTGGTNNQIQFGACTYNPPGVQSIPTVGLPIPDGQCNTNTTGNTVTITNTGSPGHIQVQGGNAIPSDNGKNWALCAQSAQTVPSQCTGAVFNGTSHVPGADEFAEFTVNTQAVGNISVNYVAVTPQCDPAFGGNSNTTSCAASINSSATEYIHMFGPTSTTDPAPDFTQVVTWTVTP